MKPSGAPLKGHGQGYPPDEVELPVFDVPVDNEHSFGKFVGKLARKIGLAAPTKWRYEFSRRRRNPNRRDTFDVLFRQTEAQDLVAACGSCRRELGDDDRGGR